MEPLGLIKQSFDVRYSNWVHEALDELTDSFTITDPCISGHPIVFASRGFLKMSGYSRDEVIGKNGRMFQGPRTNRRTVMEIREAIREERSLQINILNYRKDGSPFWMLFHLCPVFSKDDGRVVNFVAVQVPILRRSISEFSGLGLTSSCGNGLGFCRREMCSDSVAELARVFALDTVLDDDNVGLGNEPCKASEIEKRKAESAMNNILSMLTHYSELTGKLVCAKRCNLSVMSPLGASFYISIGRIKQSFVLTDPYLPDMPIVYANDGFLKLTGYTRDEVLGQNCRLLSGQDTDPTTQYQIKESIRTEQACSVHILNYRKDGSSFWNFLHISPVRSSSGKIAYYVGVQLDVSNKDRNVETLRPDIRHLSAVGAVKVAIRSLSMGASTSC
uniref:Putative LOV domain-containing protein n=1 Tax=Dipsacus asper TaxID=516548 RepID=A0A126WYQ9_9DIPS|nr:putative LOV domain-containing protein [Dipsacus asper]